MRYVLITAAKNEVATIAHTLESVVAQTRLPAQWLIVDDGSRDATTDTVEAYAVKHPWITLIRRPLRDSRSFAGKVESVNLALKHVREPFPEVVGNLDADVSFCPDYMEFLLHQFAADVTLGVAGTPFTQTGDYDSTRDSFEGDQYVAGPCQLFRWSCFRDIGGYVPHAAGGVDWIAVMTARMQGWTVRSFSEHRFHHHRAMGTAEKGPVSALFAYGQKDYYLGGSPLWQFCRMLYRMTKPPVLVGGLALAAGYLWAAACRTPRPVSPELMAFHRRDQMRKLKAVATTLLRLERVNGFSLSVRRQAKS